MRGLWLSAALFVAAPASAAEFNHVLVIILDDVGTDKVGAYAGDVSNPTEDRPQTPGLDLVAAAGVRFSDAWASPYCSPTRSMILSGGYPSRVGVGGPIGEGSEVRLGTITDTLMKLAQDNGLRTGLFGKSHLGTTDATLADEGQTFGLGDYPITLGFDYFAGNHHAAVDAYDDWLYTVSRPVYLTGRRYVSTASNETTSPTTVTTDDAVAWMESGPPGSRRMTVVSYNLAHDTSGSTGRWDSGARSCGAKPGTDVENMKVMVECLDTAVLDLLSATPDLGDTLVIIVSDNGTADQVAEGNFNDGRGKGSVYENGVRVPLLIADGAAIGTAIRNGGGIPARASFRIEAGSTVSDPSSVVDIFTTVADFLNLSSRTCVPGSTCGKDSLSLRSVLTGGPAIRTEVWTESWTSRTTGIDGRAAIRSGDMKLVLTARRGAECRSYQMYDLASDRWETDDLYEDATYTSERDELLTLLAAHEAEMNVAWIPETECGS